jgi:hypothetical protein
MDLSKPIMISRDGQQFGPYSLQEARGYFLSGNIVPTDLAWDAQASIWIPIAEIPGITTTAPPVSVLHRRNTLKLILAGLGWWILLLVVSLWMLAFLAGLIAGLIYPSDPVNAGLAAGNMVKLPGTIVVTILVVWLIVTGKLPGTGK